MDTILEGLLKEIITEKFFTEIERQTTNEFGTHHSLTESTASIVASKISHDKDFMEGVRDKLIDRFILLLNKGTIDEQIAKGVSDYIKNNMGNFNSPAIVSGLLKDIPNHIATQLINGDKNILAGINLQGLTDKINAGNIEIKVTLKN